MLYLLTGKMFPHAQPQSTAEFQKLLKSRFVPGMQAVLNAPSEFKVIGGGVKSGSRTLAILVDVPNHLAIRRFLLTLPIIDMYEWDVTPLDSFQEIIDYVEHD